MFPPLGAVIPYPPSGMPAVLSPEGSLAGLVPSRQPHSGDTVARGFARCAVGVFPVCAPACVSLCSLLQDRSAARPTGDHLPLHTRALLVKRVRCRPTAVVYASSTGCHAPLCLCTLLNHSVSALCWTALSVHTAEPLCLCTLLDHSVCALCWITLSVHSAGPLCLCTPLDHSVDAHRWTTLSVHTAGPLCLCTLLNHSVGALC